MIKYIELKSGYSDNGPAWIARVGLSKSGRTIYFSGKALKRISGSGVSGNHHDMETGEEYWISGVKRTGTNRHRAGSGKISIEKSAVDEYMCALGIGLLDESIFQIVDDFDPPDSQMFHCLENEKPGE